MKKYFDTVENSQTGRPLVGATVRVREQSALGAAPGDVATIYTDINGTEPSTPGEVVTDDYGYYEFFAADGVYTFEFLFGGNLLRVVRDIAVNEDDAEGAAASAAAAAASAEEGAAHVATAAASETQAGLYAAAAQAFAGGLYADTTAGLAGTTSGDYFLVVGSGDTFATLYLDNAGTAVAQDLDIPSLAALEAMLGTAREETRQFFPYATGNLFDKTTAINDGNRLWTAGSLAVLAGYAYTDYFDIADRGLVVGDSLTTQIAAGPLGADYQFFQSNGTHISTTLGSSGAVVIPALTAKMRYGVSLTYLDTAMLFKGGRVSTWYIPGNLRQLDEDLVTQPRRDGLKSQWLGDSQFVNASSMSRRVTDLLGFDNNPNADNVAFGSGNQNHADAYKNFGNNGTGLTANISGVNTPTADANFPFAKRWMWLDATRAETYIGTFVNDAAGAIQATDPMTLGVFNTELANYFADPITNVSGGVVTGGSLVNTATIYGALIYMRFGLDVMMPGKPVFYIGPFSWASDYVRWTTTDGQSLNTPEFARVLGDALEKLGAYYFNPWERGSKLNYHSPATRALYYADTVHFNADGHAQAGDEILIWRRSLAV